ncbi:MAG: serine/threonine protein kinase [Acidobacteria bacterium]|nr:serine/threonine protein kinase [Acidobacteriota bacterium]
MNSSVRHCVCGAVVSRDDWPHDLCPRCLIALAIEPSRAHTAGAGAAAGGDAPSVPGESLPTIPGYEIVKLLGAGGMGQVYLAEQSSPLRRTVALKVLRMGIAPEAAARFETERQALALMEHPAIATVFDAGMTPDGRPYFVMEYVNGEPLTTFCDRNGLSVRERLDLFVQVCDGVQHAHQKGVIHRDLKPSNVLVTLQDSKPVPKIIDFGVAKATARPLTERTLFTEFGVMIGTPEYMSPEQAGTTGLDVDTRTDVYALGVILYELLTGALPFEREQLRAAGFDEIRRVMLEADPPRPSAKVSTLGDRSASATNRHTDPGSLRRLLRGDLDWITMRALEKDRERRYGSVADLAADVLRHRKHEPVLASAPSAAYRARKFARRHRVGVTVAAAALIMLIGFTVTTTLQARRIAAEREVSDRVAAFLADALSSAKPKEMGASLWKDLRARVAEAQHRRGRSPQQSEATLASFDEALAGVNATDTALHLLDEEVLDRAGTTIQRDQHLEPRIAGELERRLAAAYLRLGLIPQAQQHGQRAVEILNRTLGSDHVASLEAANVLGSAHQMLGHFAEARELFEQTLAIRRRTQGARHPDTLRTMVNVANTYTALGQYAHAASLYQETLEIQREVVGEENEYTLNCMNNLAVTYFYEGRMSDAATLFERTIGIEERVLGPEHRSTLDSMAVLAQVYTTQGRLADAEKLLTRTIAVQRRALGSNDPYTGATLEYLGELYRQQGRLAEAEQALREAVQTLQKSAGEDHPQTLDCLFHLGLTYAGAHRHADAEKAFAQTVAGQRQVLGPEHPDTLRTLHYFGESQFAQGRLDEAEKVFRELIPLLQRALGPDDALAMEPVFRLACIAARRGDRQQALARVAEAVDRGWKDADRLSADSDLKLLHGDAAFEALLTRARETAATSKE